MYISVLCVTLLRCGCSTLLFRYSSGTVLWMCKFGTSLVEGSVQFGYHLGLVHWKLVTQFARKLRNAKLRRTHAFSSLLKLSEDGMQRCRYIQHKERKVSSCSKATRRLPLLFYGMSKHDSTHPLRWNCVQLPLRSPLKYTQHCHHASREFR